MCRLSTSRPRFGREQIEVLRLLGFEIIEVIEAIEA
jgi:hypothetical protein